MAICTAHHRKWLELHLKLRQKIWGECLQKSLQSWAQCDSVVWFMTIFFLLKWRTSSCLHKMICFCTHQAINWLFLMKDDTFDDIWKWEHSKKPERPLKTLTDRKQSLVNIQQCADISDCASSEWSFPPHCSVCSLLEIQLFDTSFPWLVFKWQQNQKGSTSFSGLTSLRRLVHGSLSFWPSVHRNRSLTDPEYRKVTKIKSGDEHGNVGVSVATGEKNRKAKLLCFSQR